MGTLEIHGVTNADAWGYEPVWNASGGFGHSVGKSLAMAYVDPKAAETGMLSVHVLGARHAASVLTEPPYDPKGLRMFGADPDYKSIKDVDPLPMMDQVRFEGTSERATL